MRVLVRGPRVRADRRHRRNRDVRDRKRLDRAGDRRKRDRDRELKPFFAVSLTETLLAEVLAIEQDSCEVVHSTHRAIVEVPHVQAIVRA